MALRLRWLFPLAMFCGCPPPVTDGLSLIDFARLVDECDGWLRHLARQQQPGA